MVHPRVLKGPPGHLDDAAAAGPCALATGSDTPTWMIETDCETSGRGGIPSPNPSISPPHNQFTHATQRTSKSTGRSILNQSHTPRYPPISVRSVPVEREPDRSCRRGLDMIRFACAVVLDPLQPTGSIPRPTTSHGPHDRVDGAGNVWLAAAAVAAAAGANVPPPATRCVFRRASLPREGGTRMHAVCVPDQSTNQGRLAGWLASRLIDPFTRFIRTKQQERGVSNTSGVEPEPEPEPRPGLAASSSSSPRHFDERPHTSSGRRGGQRHWWRLVFARPPAHGEHRPGLAPAQPRRWRQQQ